MSFVMSSPYLLPFKKTITTATINSVIRFLDWLLFFVWMLITISQWKLIVGWMQLTLPQKEIDTHCKYISILKQTNTNIGYHCCKEPLLLLCQCEFLHFLDTLILINVPFEFSKAHVRKLVHQRFESETDRQVGSAEKILVATWY